MPKHVHWDLFLGVAPERPYAVYPPNGKGERKCAYHPFDWRGWWDFGTGALGDMACHTANMAFMALKLGYPTSVVAECGELNPETYPSWATVVLRVPGPRAHAAGQVLLVRGQEGRPARICRPPS